MLGKLLGKLFSALSEWWTQNKSDRALTKSYREAGEIFGDAVSMIYMGECIGFERLLDTWAHWEQEYARRGFRTIPLDDFVDTGGYGVPLKGLGQRRAPDEEPVFHAEIYRKIWLGKVPAAVDMDALMDGKVHVGNYIVPSTTRKDGG